MIEKISAKEYLALVGSPSKFGAIRTVCSQNHTHASKKEAVRCLELTLLCKKGTISRLKQQVKFVLQKEFTHQGEKVRPLCYVADFTYYEGGKYIIEDVKGARTDVYTLKRKLLLNQIKGKKTWRFIET